MTVKPVGIDENSLFPPRVETRLSATFATKDQTGVATRKGVFSTGSVNTTNNTITNILHRVPVVLPVTTTRWRMRYRNADGYGSAKTGLVSLTGLYIGTHLLDADGLGTGNFTAPPAQAYSVDSIAGGAEFVGAWITNPALQFTGRQQHLISFGVFGSAGQVWGRTINTAKFKTGVASTQVGDQTVTSFGGSTGVFGDLRIEYEYEGDAESVLFVGDSLTDGLQSALGQVGNYPNTIAVRSGQPAAISALSGVTAQDVAGYTDASYWYWARNLVGSGYTPDAAVLLIGTNDIATRTDVQLKADIGTIVLTLRSFGIKRVYAGTLTPRAYTAGSASETLRLAINAWLRTRPFGLLDVFEFDRAVLAAGSTTAMDPDYDSGDGLHFNVAGYARLARAIPGAI